MSHGIEGHNVNDDTTHETLKDLLPAYAIGALDEAEARPVADHLGECPACEQELAALRETLATLAFSAPAAVPAPGVRAALLDRVERLAATSGATPPVIAPTSPPAALSVAPRKLPRRVGQLHRARIGLAALAAVLVLGLLGWGILAQSRLNTERQQLAAERQRAEQLAAQAGQLTIANEQLVAQTRQFPLVNTLLNKPEAAYPVSGPTVTDYGLPAAGYVYVDPTSNIGLMLTYWLPKIGADQRFQIWLVTPEGQRDSGGLFSADARGNAHVVINAPEPFAKYKSVGVTVEPAAGSTGPTSPRVCGGDIR